MTHCPSCLRPVPDEALSCPACGVAMNVSATPTKHQPAPEPEYAGASPALRADGPVKRLPSAAVRSDGRFIAGAMLAGRYRIVCLLGRGGMGEVYKAEDIKLHQTVALKFLPEAIALDAAALARFHNEVRIARQVAHPNVCHVYDIGEVEGLNFLSMEFIDGEDLAALLKKVGRLPGDKAVELARQICAGLAAAHEEGVLHRDLKPSNVMIDSRGKARITDFGLAGVIEEIRADEVQAGTPAYMAPEQLSGKEATQRSDIYSLGLVLYELFTGKRVFEAKSVAELMELHEKSAPTTPSSHVKEIDPLAERVILRCLEKDPRARPASAVQVALALPGGDPLQAALVLGETPSPEMIAASGAKTGLRPAVAVACLAGVIVGLLFYALVATKAVWQKQALIENSPDTLAHKARDIITRLGYTDKPTDSAFGLSHAIDYLRDKSVNQWSQLTKNQPAAIYFWYRESPRYLEVDGWSVGEYDPPLDVSGMVSVRLDPLGRLLAFAVVPPQVDRPSTAVSPPDWAALFGVAGLEPASFIEVEPQWAPLAGFNARAAWTGAYPDQPEIPLRIEAAAWRGKPIYFEIVYPWTRPDRMQAYGSSTGEHIYGIILLSLSLVVLIGAALLVRRNFRQGQGDRRGAFRLALFVFSINVLFWIFGASHVPTLKEVENLFRAISLPGLLLACAFWLLYLALEPYVRRRWPVMLISWSRVLGGALRDPLVGRDVLVGTLFGICGRLLFVTLDNLIRYWRDEIPVYPNSPDLAAWVSGRFLVAYGFCTAVIMGIALTLVNFFMIFLLRVVTRRQWLTAGIFVLFWVMMTSLGPNATIITAVFNCLHFTLFVIIFLRFGLVAGAVGIFIELLLFSAPITTDFSAWYAGTGLIALLVVLALAAYGYRTAIAGQSLFRGQFIDD